MHNKYFPTKASINATWPNYFRFFWKTQEQLQSRCSEQILPAGHVNKLNDFRALNKGWLIIWDWNKYLGLDFHLYSFLCRDLFLLFLYRNFHGPWTSLGPARKPALWQKLRFHFSVNLYKNANIFQHFLRLQTTSRKKMLIMLFIVSRKERKCSQKESPSHGFIWLVNFMKVSRQVQSTTYWNG